MKHTISANIITSLVKVGFADDLADNELSEVGQHDILALIAAHDAARSFAA